MSIYKDLEKCDELYYHVKEVIGVDDKKAPENYTKEELIAEAKFVLSKYNPAEGYIHGEEILGEHGESAKTKALLERKQIEQFLKKHDKA